MSNEVSGLGGLIGITAAVIGVSVIITGVTGNVGHWLPVIGGIVVGWMAVSAITG